MDIANSGSSSSSSSGRVTTTRLMITSMELENFKSYAGAQEIGVYIIDDFWYNL